ncbi:MAG: hypothetical protein HWD86_00320 [Kangiellaceae bacterium]|nr:hypothetical protein [Kangiellaceae bacterium]
MLLNSLKAKINKDIKDTFKKNENFLNTRWNYAENNILLWSKHYLKYPILSFLLSILLIINFSIWEGSFTPFLDKYIPDVNALTEWQSVFFAGQLTMVAVIYPLVIALMSILIQDKSAKKVIFPVYQEYSGFMYSGLSGLLLSGFITIGFVVEATISNSIYIAICLISFIWLIINIVLTAWFFIQTFRILESEEREKLVLRYAIHELFFPDVCNRIKTSCLTYPVQLGLINNNFESLATEDISLPDDDFEDLIRKNKHEGYTVVNVHYWLINIALKLQSKKLKKKGITNGVIVFQLYGSKENRDKLVIARHRNFKINPFVKFLIKRSYKIRKLSSGQGNKIPKIISATVGSAQDALKKNDSIAFKQAINDIAYWHTEISKASSFIDDNGKPDNWLLLSSSSIFSRSYLIDFLQEYYELAKECVEKIPSSSSFYYSMLYLYHKILSSRTDVTTKEALEFIKGNYHMWFLLMEWRSFTSKSDDVRVSTKYQDILYDFVGAWEHWESIIQSNGFESIEQAQEGYQPILHHLNFTATSIVSALRFNNYEAAEWGIDMLNRWIEKISSGERNYQYEYSWVTQLIYPQLLLKDIGDEEWKNILSGNEFDVNSALNIALQNSAFDLRLITACYILLKPYENKDKLKNFVELLLEGTGVHQDNIRPDYEYRATSPSNVLGAYIRQKNYSSKESSYENWLSGVLQSFGRINEERRVTGRIYSGWGAEDLSSMNKSYVEIGIAYSSSDDKWQLDKRWQDIIKSDAIDHANKNWLISDLKRWINIARKDKDFLLFNKSEIRPKVHNYIKSIIAIIRLIKNTQDERVSEAALDEDRLQELARACSNFVKGSERKFPLNLFRHTGFSPESKEHEEYNLNFKDYRKEKISVGISASRPINEEEFLSKSLEQFAYDKVLDIILRSSTTRDFSFDTIDHFLNSIPELTERLRNPVLIIGDREIKTKLRHLLFDQNTAERYQITRSDGYPTPYICHIGNLAIYGSRLNPDFSILTSKEVFEQVDFAELTKGQFSNVEFVPENDNDLVGKLVLSFKMKVVITNDKQIYKITINENNDS